MNMIIKEILSAILLTILIPAALFSTVPAYEPLQNSQPMRSALQPVRQKIRLFQILSPFA